MASAKSSPSTSTATIGFEAKLWLTADKLRNNMDAAEYKHVVLGLIFLKYISDTFEEHGAKLLKGKLGPLIDRVHRALTDADLAKITSTYHAWRGSSADFQSAQGKMQTGKSALLPYADIAGFCKSATTADIAAHGHVFTPGRYVGAEYVEDDGDPFEEKMPRLVAELAAQFAESAKLEQAIRANLKGLGYGV
jgi:type I restriction-modification system DNA methylase subunit